MALNFSDTPLAAPSAAKPKSKGYESLDIWALAGEQPARLLSPEDSALQAVVAEREQLARHEEELKAKAAELTQALASCAQLMQSIEADRQNWWKEIRQEIVQVTLHVAEKVVENELSINPALVSRCVEKVIAQFETAQALHIFLNPADLAFLEKENAAWLEGVKAKGAKFEVRPDMPRGNCSAETEKVRVEAGLSRTFEALWKQAVEEETPVPASPAPSSESEVEPT